MKAVESQSSTLAYLTVFPDKLRDGANRIR